MTDKLTFSALKAALARLLEGTRTRDDVSIREWTTTATAPRITIERKVAGRRRYVTLAIVEEGPQLGQVSLLWGEWPFPPGSSGEAGFDARRLGDATYAMAFVDRWLFEWLNWQDVPDQPTG